LSKVEGMVIRAHGGFYYARTQAGKVTCRLRGTLKQAPWESDLIAVGDRVQIMLTKPGQGVIEEVLPRESALSRQAPLPKGKRPIGWTEREQVLVANPDQAVFVFACAEPFPRLRMLDRLLVGAEVQHIPAVVCANKIDLVSYTEAQALFGTYEEIGYPVLYTSAKDGDGVDALHDALQGKLSALMGPSGVGKTSLLNAMQPGLGLRVREVSQATAKGRHTTVVPQIVPLEAGGWVADTPGIRALALFDLDPEELDAYFPDIAPLVTDCRFSDCTHAVEPGCAVIQAVEDGRVSEHRYESYVRLHEEHQKLADMYWWGIQ